MPMLKRQKSLQKWTRTNDTKIVPDGVSDVTAFVMVIARRKIITIKHIRKHWCNSDAGAEVIPSPGRAGMVIPRLSWKAVFEKT